MIESFFDSHVHLDERGTGGATEAVAQIEMQLAGTNGWGALVLHLDWQRWSLEDVSTALKGSSKCIGFRNVRPSSADCSSVFDETIELGFRGFKLHPRLEQYGVGDDNTVEFCSAAGQAGLPVLLDTFPDGHFIRDGFSPSTFARLAHECPSTTFIFAHMGGQYFMDFMMIGKRFQNVLMDLSFSFLYFRESTISRDMVYAIRSLGVNRVLYGSDYPDRTISHSFLLTRELLDKYGMPEGEQEQLFNRNAASLFGIDIDVS